ncbi:MAG: hypothetical protein IJR14_08270 [Synergistaceae bacterium]|nr:hypothetical protein [Synergistaceae bacterium]
MIEYGGMRVREPVYEPSLRRFEHALFDRWSGDDRWDESDDWDDDEDDKDDHMERS